MNTEAEKTMALEAVTRLVNTQQTEDLVRAVVNCRMCELVIALQLLLDTFYKGSINPITDLNPVYSHSYT
jgi:hypothetical protein